MNDLPKSKYDPQGRPIKTSIFDSNPQLTNHKNKNSSSLKTFIFIVIFIYILNIYFKNSIIDTILFPIMYLIIILTIVYLIANSNIKKSLQDKDNLKQEEIDDFDIQKADKLIEEFNK